MLLINVKINKNKNGVIRSTKYCDLLKQGRVDTDRSASAIEKIYVKELGRTEIRFAYYKKTANNRDRLVLRPLDLDEDELLELFDNAVKNEVFSENFRKKLKEIL